MIFKAKTVSLRSAAERLLALMSTLNGQCKSSRQVRALGLNPLRDA